MAVDIVIPTIAESVTDGVIQRWLKKDGEIVQRDETVLELETDKVTMEIAAPAGGRLSIKANQGTKVKVGEAVGSVDESAAGSAPAPAKAASAREAESGSGAPPQPQGGSTALADRDPRATPLARKLAQEHSVELHSLSPRSGGRIREQDVLDAIARRDQPAGVRHGAPPSSPAVAPKAPPAGSRGVQRERLPALRQRIAQRLVQAQHTAAMLTTFNECDMGAVMALRKQYKDEFEKKFDVGLGFMGFFVRAAVLALRSFPMVNAYIVNDEQGEPAIERHDYCDIAIAVSTERGLVVPVLRNSEGLGLADIERAIKDVAQRAKLGKITIDEMQGGTFTITNGGIFGSLMSTPILNTPQSAILGMHTIKTRPVEFPPGSGQIALRPMMYLALSYDHRLIDGAEAVQFLVKIKQCVEDPQRLVLGM